MRNRIACGRIRKLTVGAAISVLLSAGAFGSVAAVGSTPADNATAFANVAQLATVMQQSLQDGSWLTMQTNRHALAEAVAPFVGVEPWELADAWAVTDPRRQIVVYTALAQLARPYVSFGDRPAAGFDCSGLTQYSWATAGITLEHQSEAQAGQGQRRTFISALPGDLLHYPGHIGLFLGAGHAIVHAVNHETGLAIGIANERSTTVVAPID